MNMLYPPIVGDDLLIQSALLDWRTAKPQPRFMRFVMACYRWL